MLHARLDRESGWDVGYHHQCLTLCDPCMPLLIHPFTTVDHRGLPLREADGIWPPPGHIQSVEDDVEQQESHMLSPSFSTYHILVGRLGVVSVCKLFGCYLGN